MPLPASQRIIHRDPFVMGAVLLLLTSVIAVGWIFWMTSQTYRLAGPKADPFQLIYWGVRLMQITLGMLIGLILTLFGVIMAWFGVTQGTDVNFDSAAVKARLVSAGPGALLVLCGTVLLLYSLSLKLEIKTEQTQSELTIQPR